MSFIARDRLGRFAERPDLAAPVACRFGHATQMHPTIGKKAWKSTRGAFVSIYTATL